MDDDKNLKKRYTKKKLNKKRSTKKKRLNYEKSIFTLIKIF